MIGIVDAHIHLSDDEFVNTLHYILADARATRKILFSVSVDKKSSIANLNLSRRWPKIVKAFVGIHPLSVINEDFGQFKKLVTEYTNEFSGIGEIGLDRKYINCKEEYDLQKVFFTQMLSMAEAVRKPVSVHSRGSSDEVLDILSTYNLPAVLLHWFSGDIRQLNVACDRGYYVSYGPTVVYSRKSLGLARLTPVDHILTETDGPVRYGACFSSKSAVPSFIASVIVTLANTLSSRYDDLANQVIENSKRYLGGHL